MTPGMGHPVPRRTARATVLGAALLLLGGLAAGCSGSDEPDAGPTASPSAVVTPTPPPTAAPVAGPEAGACFRLTFRQAVSPTNGAEPVRCRQRHTAETFAIGTVDNVVDGHLLAVDSERVQQQVATTCPDRLGRFVGGSLEDQRLSMLRAVWFTPSLEASSEGAAWFRCDVVALAGQRDLLAVTGSLEGVLGTEEGRQRYGMCGTASPSERSFERVPCSAEHSWRAFSVLPLEPGDYPGRRAVSEAGAPCEDAAAGIADDPLSYRWASEGPDAQEWAAGQTFVRCWTED
ncbi:septum formation family protein [Nocardioides litoris]|uniref:septum formation family protein n=1 Tax=Nocardioides litoris TaxID=1926648 RepID=UPI001FE71AAA|nr:septum formation family protein [Nocardioides litoris]